MPGDVLLVLQVAVACLEADIVDQAFLGKKKRTQLVFR